MFCQGLLLAAVVAVASAHLLPAPVHVVAHHAPQPYKFGYSIKDKHGEQHREEVGNGGHAVKGSYGFTDDRGIHRQVNYVADKAGFRAQVKTNEPGTANQNPAAVEMISNAPYGHGYAAYAAAPAVVAGPGLVAQPALAGAYGVAPVPMAGYGYAALPATNYGLSGAPLANLGYPRYGY